MKVLKKSEIERAALEVVEQTPGVLQHELAASVASMVNASPGYAYAIVSRMDSMTRRGSLRKVKCYPQTVKKISWFEWLLKKVGV